MKLTLFEITLDNPEAVYCAGQTVHGTLHIELKAPMKMEGKHML